ncbi:hypothetical protein P7C70_g9546, partial [Phenoliferia sp. Uapishka_3]
MNPNSNPNQGFRPPAPPVCYFCMNEDGPPHWMYTCKALEEALRTGLVSRSQDNKIMYKMRFIPSRANPRGMRGWIEEQEARAKDTAALNRNVSFAEVKSNSVEYDPPEISEGSGDYETAQVQVDEYEVNAGKRVRSVSPDDAPPKARPMRNHRPKESIFEDFGPARGGETSEKETDTEMKDAPRKKSSPRQKYESPLEAKADSQLFMDTILQQPVTLPMRVMLENSPELVKSLMNECRRRRAPAVDTEINHLGWEQGEEEHQVNNSSFDGKQKIAPSKSYYAGVLAFATVHIEGISIRALLDNGSMICMMQDEVRRKLGLPIRTDGTHRVRMAGGSLETLMGISENVPVRIGGVTTYVHFFISKGSTNQVL